MTYKKLVEALKGEKVKVQLINGEQVSMKKYELGLRNSLYWHKEISPGTNIMLKFK